MNIINKELNNFIEYLKEKRYSKSTFNSYFFALKDFFNFLTSKNNDINNFSKKDILEYKKQLLGKNTNQTINAKLAAIKKYIDYLKTRSKINLEWDINIIKTKTKKDIIKIENITKILSYIDKITKDKFTRERDKLIIQMLYFTGLRTKEIIKIKKKDIKSNYIIIDGKKIILNKNLFNNIITYIKLLNINDDEYVFFNFSPAYKNGKFKPHLTEKSVQDLFNKYKSIINKNLSIIDLRNSYILNNKDILLDIGIKKINLYNIINFNSDYLKLNNK